jgi:hypothetical protein
MTLKRVKALQISAGGGDLRLSILDGEITIEACSCKERACVYLTLLDAESALAWLTRAINVLRERETEDAA